MSPQSAPMTDHNSDKDFDMGDRFDETSPYTLEELYDLHPEWFEGDTRLEPLLKQWRARSRR